MAKPNPAQTNNTKPTMAEILDAKKPLEDSCEILMDAGFAEQLQALERQKVEADREARSGTKDVSQKSSQKIEKEIDALWEQASEYIVEFKFRSISKSKLDELARAYPPSEEQKKTYKANGFPGVLEYNPDEFAPALIAATCYEPEMTMEQAQKLFDHPAFTAGEIDLMFTTAMKVSQGRASIPFSKRGTGGTPNSG